MNYFPTLPYVKGLFHLFDLINLFKLLTTRKYGNMILDQLHLIIRFYNTRSTNHFHSKYQYISIFVDINIIELNKKLIMVRSENLRVEIPEIIWNSLG